MQNKITFTIGIPAYKSKFLKECVDSVLSQTFESFELIIVNDASPHPVDEVVKSFEDNRIRYYVNEFNIGAENVVDNWNKCLNLARGEYFVLMGDDDVMDPEYLEEFVSLIGKYKTLDVFHCRTMLIDEMSNPIGLVPSWPEFESVYDNIWHRLNGHRTQFISDFVYKTSTLIRNGGFFNLPLAWGSDDLSAFVAAGSKGIAHINKPIFKYRNNQFNISSTGNSHLKMRAIMLQENWFKAFLVNKPTSVGDQILAGEIAKNLTKYIQRKKIYNISMSFNGVGFLKNTIDWALKRKQYQISLIEVLYAVFEKLKRGKIKQDYTNITISNT